MLSMAVSPSMHPGLLRRIAQVRGGPTRAHERSLAQAGRAHEGPRAPQKQWAFRNRKSPKSMEGPRGPTSAPLCKLGGPTSIYFFLFICIYYLFIFLFFLFLFFAKSMEAPRAACLACGRGPRAPWSKLAPVAGVRTAWTPRRAHERPFPGAHERPLGQAEKAHEDPRGPTSRKKSEKKNISHKGFAHFSVGSFVFICCQTDFVFICLYLFVFICIYLYC
jgi:hypothetical protein